MSKFLNRIVNRIALVEIKSLWCRSNR